MRVVSWASLLVTALACCLASSAVGSEKYEFQAEVSRLMDIIVNSLYSKKEVFLRELVSNAADALDKTRYLGIENPAILADKAELEIRVSFDQAERTLTIRDSGVGMTKEDLINNLGTVARSGTTQFVESMAKGGDLSLIGQFGVGFYSVYLVSDKVQVRSKNHDDDQYIWESTADSTFTIDQDPEGNTLGRGTEIKLFLKEDAVEYTDQERLTALVNRYSEFIQFPIYLHKSKTETVTEDEEEEDDDEEDGDEEDDEEEDGDEDEESADKKDKAAPKTREVTTWTWEHVNTQPAIWGRAASEVEKEEYVEFYKSISKDYSDPLTWTHFRAEGEVEFKSILYVPGATPMGMYDNYYNIKAALKLYVRKVLVTDTFEDLIPKYLNFVKGVVDSDDLPINVSREMLQEHKILKVIGKKLVRKILELLRKMSEAEQESRKTKKGDDDEDEEDEDDEDEDNASTETKAEKAKKYATFWKAFGKNIKMGVIEDTSNRNRLNKLLRFKTTTNKDEDAQSSLDEYMARMPEWQKDIYFLAGQNLKEVEDSPLLERAQAKGVEVLLMDDPLDEYVIQQLPSYESAKLVSLAKEGLKFGDESADDEAREKLYKEEYKALATWMKSKIQGLDKVVISSRLTDTPAVLVTGQFGYSSNMQRIMKAQAFGSGNSAASMTGTKIMEINPRHPIVATIKSKVDANEDDEDAQNLAWLLFDTATLSSGYEMDEPKLFAARMYKLMQSELSLESLDLLPEIDVPAPKSESDDDESQVDLDEVKEL